MKRIVLYILLVVMVTDTTALTQLFKVRFLVQHYNEHQQLDKDLTLIRFLSMHYWGEDLPDHDEDRDNQLPFKKQVVTFQYHCYCVPVQRFELIIPLLYDSPVYGLPKAYNLPEAHLNGLLRPPKMHALS